MSPAGTSLRRQFADTMLAVGDADPDLVVMVGDISHGILKPFAAAHPDRYFNIGILEPTMMSMGAGLARVGLYPVLHTIAPFLMERAFEQIKLDFCYHRLPGNVVTVGGTFDYANLGCTHHCYGDFALLKTLPRVEITNPASAVEFDRLFRQTYRNDRLTVFKLAGTDHGVAFDAADILPGKAIRVAEGQDVSLIAVGPQLRSAVGARDILAARGIGAEILYLHSIRPFDAEAVLASAAKTRKVAVIEEHMESGGAGDDVLRAVRKLPEVGFVSVSIPDAFVTGYGTYDDHCEALGLTARGVAARVTAELF